MTETLQPGHHPDADQLNAFVEHDLPDHERKQLLAHLATCTDCRAIVYLAQPAPLEEAPLPQPAAARRPLLLGWSLAWTAGLALACLILVTVHLHNVSHDTHRTAPVTTAELRPTPMEAPLSQPAIAPKPVHAAVHQPQATPLLNHSFDAKKATDSGTVQEMPRQQALHGSLQVRSTTATPNPDLRAESKATIGRQPVLGSMASANFVSASPTPAAASPLSSNQLPGPPLSESDAAQLQLGSAVTGASAQRAPAAPTALHSLSQQYSSAPFAQTAAAPPPPLASVPDATSIETENNGASTVLAGAAVSAAELRQSLPPQSRPILPSHLAALSTISNAQQELAIDTAGTLFRSDDAGVTWQPIPAQWTGRAVKLSLSSSGSRVLAKSLGSANATVGAGKPTPLAQSSIFELTTDAGNRWTSADGKIWKHE